MAPYNDLPPERQSRAEEYIRTLTAIEDKAGDITQIQSGANIDKQTCQSVTQTLALIERTARKERENAQRDCEITIEAALKKRDQHIKDTNACEKTMREQMEQLRAECIARLDTVEVQISKVNTMSEKHRKRKLALETEGGFELGLDVGLMKRAKKG
jgi:predicted transcriptional regulator